jgi:serine/threonine protein kinase
MATPPVFPSPAPESDIVGHMAGEYRLRKKLGEGGYGAVYEAEHPVLKRRAAVKVLHRAAGGNSDGVRRFIAEAQAASHIRSRHIVDIFSFGTLPDGRHFYVMDLLEGEALDRYIRRESRLAVPAALQLLRPIAEALDAAHAADIVHRDLKPQNIFLVWEPGGETVPKLLDFGTAKLLGPASVHTMSGTVIGTPMYMSPEQALGQAVDARADVYALGLLCHELLTGHPPITGASAIAVLAAHLTQKPPPVSQVGGELSPELDAPILRMLEKDPAQRPASAGAAIAELVRAAERAGHVIPPGMPHLPEPPPASQSARQEPAAPSSYVPAAPWAEERSTERGLQRDTLQRSRETGSSKRALGWAAFAVLAVGAVAATYIIGGAANRPIGPPPDEASPPRLVLPLASSSPPSTVDTESVSPPAAVEVTVQGAPRGARISLDGKPLGEAPGPVPVPFGNGAVSLTISASGYEPTRVSVVPDRASSTAVVMRKRAAGPSAPREGFPSDLENPF